MFRFVPALTLLLLPLLAPAQYLHFTLHGDPGEWLSRGQDWDITYTPANAEFLNARLRDLGSRGYANDLDLSARRRDNPAYGVYGHFSTSAIPSPLAPGTYENAVLWDIARPGQPGLDVGFMTRGNSSLTGSFTINEIAFHRDGSGYVLDAFDGSFLIHSEGGPLACWGTLTYNAVPEPSSAVLCGACTLLFAKLRRRRSQSQRF